MQARRKQHSALIIEMTAGSHRRLALNMFYNTALPPIFGAANRKPEHRKARFNSSTRRNVQPLRKNLGKKNCELSEEDIQRICQTFLDFKETEQSKIFPNAAFGYWKVTVERPLRLKGLIPTRGTAPRDQRRSRDRGTRREGPAGHHEDPQADEDQGDRCVIV